MDTLTPAETSLSVRSVATVGVVALVSAALSLPSLVVPAYGRVVAGALLVVCVGIAVRFAVAVAVAAPRHDPPPAPETLPTVSLVVTAYNEADVLPETIDACLALDYPADRLEVVVGYESASTDATATIAEAAADAHARVRAVERPAPPGGKAAATNHALPVASGDLVAVLDADQRLAPDAVTRAVGWFEDDGVWCVKGRCLGTNPADSLVALCVTVERSLVERLEFVARDRLGGFTIFTGGQAFFRASVFDRVGGFDETVLLEDLDMAYRLQRAGGVVRVDPGIVTDETNPATFPAWWHQRKRWARGGMQVARRYLGRGLLSGPPGPAARVDFTATFASLVLVPLLVLAAPAAVPSLPSLARSRTVVLLVSFVVATPVVTAYATLVMDALAGDRHRLVEYAAPPLLWPYLAVQVWAVVASFLDEFVLRRPTRYVTSSSDDDGG